MIKQRKNQLLLYLLICMVSVMHISIAQDSGTFTDDRDGKEYKWVRIGEQIWMGENLNFEPDFNRGETGQCPEAGVYRCEGDLGPDKCGAFYDWAMVLDLVEGYWPGTDYTEINVPKNLINNPHRGIAPEGWHIPTVQEAQELVRNFDASAFNAYPADYVTVS